MNTAPDIQDISIPVGSLRVRMHVPLSAHDPSERISFWWGITSAAIALARHIEGSEEVAGQSVAELGCGLGLPGITAAMLGAHVTFTDYVPDALESARHNARINSVSEDSTTFRTCDWENPGQLGSFTLVMGSEVVYDYFFHGSLAGLLERIVAPQGRIILADRPRLCVQRFLGRMTQRGFACSETRERVMLECFPDQEVSLFTLKRAGNHS
jgi:predicted nicotinamide N-methyase